jgi:hypothetical protein
MTRAVTIFVMVVLVNALILGYMYGFDSTAIAILCALVVVGGLAIAVARGRDKGLTAPATCASCGGLMSPNAPYCKHCGTPVSD